VTYFDQLEVELDRAAHRLHRRHQRRILGAKIAAAVVVVAVLVGGAAGLVVRGGDDASADVRITTEGGTVTVEMPLGDQPAVEVAAQLEAAGLQVRQQPSSTGPSRVGMVVGVFSAAGPTSEGEDGTVTVTLPVGAVITLLVGSPEGDDYTAFTDALAAGEPLHCIAWVGQDAAELARAAPDGLDLEFRTADDQVLPASDLDGMVVRDATAIGPDDIVVYVQVGTAVDAPPCD
jgi:hypothetical protein